MNRDLNYCLGQTGRSKCGILGSDVFVFINLVKYTIHLGSRYTISSRLIQNCLCLNLCLMEVSTQQSEHVSPIYLIDTWHEVCSPFHLGNSILIICTKES